MRILVLIHEFPPIGGGGGHIARDLCGQLSHRGHDIKVITARLLGSVSGKDMFPYDVIRTPTLRKDPSRASFLAMLTYLISAFVRAYALFQSWKPDLIHVHFAVPSGALAWLLSKCFAIPYVVTVHLGDVPGGTPKKTDRWFRFVYPFTHAIWNSASQVIAVSEFTKNLALRHYDVPIEVVPNGVEIDKYQSRDEFVHEPPKLVFAGRFVPQKNPLGIVRVMGKLHGLDWEFVMLGDGPLFQETKREIRDQGLEDHFRCPGWVSPQEVRKVFCRSDILFMPSLSEGLPVVGLQALAAGLAFVVSDIGGFIDLVDEGVNGYRIPVDWGAESGFANTLSDLLQDRDRIRSLKEKSRQKARLFDIQCISERYERLFNRVVDLERG